MANESINLNLIPKGEMPVIHVSQFDNGRQFNINLLKGSDEYTLPAGYTAVLNCRKADRNIVTLATTSVLSNTLTFTTTTQLCACSGKNICEVVIKDAEDFNVGTLNFILEVERDPLQGGIESTSEIHDLEDQIEDITTEIISENYYTKTETDTLLDAKADASSLSTVATSGNYTDLNSLPKINGMTITGNKTAQWYGLASKLNDLSDVTLSHELSEFDTLIYNSYLNKWINLKMSYNWLTDQPSIPDAQVQSDYAQSDNTKVDYIKNKPDISGMIEQAIYDIMPIASVSFSPVASFNTEISAPLQDIKCKITPSQSGEGTPSPTNIRPIIAYTSLNLTANGDTYTIAFGQTVYGGVLDVTRGKLTITHGYVDLGSLTWIAAITNVAGKVRMRAELTHKAVPNNVVFNAKCDIYNAITASETYICVDGISGENTGNYIFVYDSNYSTTADLPAFSSMVNGHYLAYELATPFDIDLTPVQISAIVGDNTVSADCGDTEVKYKDTIQHYIDTRT